MVPRDSQAMAVPRDSQVMAGQVMDNNLRAECRISTRDPSHNQDLSNQDISHSSSYLLMVDHNRHLVTKIPELDSQSSSQITANSQDSLLITDIVAHNLLKQV